MLIIAFMAILSGCKKDSIPADTRLILNITMGGSPLSNCSVDVYGSNSDWTAKTNKIASATTSNDGKVIFTGCQAQVYYLDFVYNSIIYYSSYTTSLSLNKDNSFDVVLTEMTVTFNNATYTPIKITVDGTSQQTIAVGSSFTYSLPSSSSVHFVAETNEVFLSGNQLGLKITWDTSISTPNTSNPVNLNVSSSICYFRINNNGAVHQLGPLYFNYGNANQYYVNTTLPTSGGPYNLGYHYAISGGQERGYWYPSTSSWTYWTNGVHFYYPNTTNQIVTLTNTLKGALEGKYEISKQLNQQNFNNLNPSKDIVKTYKEFPNTQQIESNVTKE